MKHKSFLLTSTASIGSTVCILSLCTTHAATTLIDTDFETGSLNPWTVSATPLTGLYQHNTALQPANTINYATSGDYAVSLNKSGGTMTSTTFDLSAASGTDSVTISLAASWINGSTTRRAFLETSLDGGTTWFWLATLQATTGVGSLTFTEGSSTLTRTGVMGSNNASTTLWNGSAFTDQMVFRITNAASAGADVRIFVDDTLITTTVAIPEPSTSLLGGLALLALLRRRR